MRRLTQTLLLAAAIVAPAIASPALAASAPHSFVANGEAYDYTTDRTKSGAVLVNGTIHSTGQAFALRVRNGHVDGTVGSSPVSFTVSPETMAQLESEIGGSTGGSATTVAAN